LRPCFSTGLPSDCRVFNNRRVVKNCGNQRLIYSDER
jgi:hypothetical protein